jgi:hypothetical protein
MITSTCAESLNKKTMPKYNMKQEMVVRKELAKDALVASHHATSYPYKLVIRKRLW